MQAGDLGLAAAASATGLSVGTVIVVVVSVLTAVFASITAPLILSHRTERIHREDQLEQYRREDQVARRAGEASSLLLLQQKQTAQAAAELVREVADQAAEDARKLQAAQKETIRRTDEVARVAAATASEASRKLDQIDAQARRIHILVNSDMTAARQSELDQTRAIAVVLRRIIALAVANPAAEPEAEDIAALKRATARITELELILADRVRQMRLVEADAAAAQSGEGTVLEDGAGMQEPPDGGPAEGPAGET